MSMAITHFAVGATLTTLVLLYLLPATRYGRSLVLVGGLWGMGPDLHWVVPIYNDELRAFHHSEFANVFWLHKTLDVVDPTDSKSVAALGLGAFAVATLAGDHWSFTTRERAEDSSDSPVEAARSLSVLGRAAGVAGVATGTAFLGMAAFVSAVPIGLYLGIGTALVVAGLVGATRTVDAGPAVATWAPRSVRLPVRALLTVGAVTAGLGLLLAPLRTGVTALTGAYAGLGSLVLLQAVTLARLLDEQRPP